MPLPHCLPSSNAREALRAAVGYLLKGAAGNDRVEIMRDIIEIVRQIARRR